MTLSGAAARCDDEHEDHHRGHQPQHAPPDRHGVVRDHDAPPHRRPLRARHRPRHRSRCSTRYGIPARHHRPDGGLHRRDAPPVARRHDHRPRRADRAYPVLRLDPTFDEDIPLGLVAFGPNSLELGGRAFDHVILHTFFADETLAAMRADGEGRGRASRTRPGVGDASGRASPRSATTCPSRCDSRRPSVASPPTSRRTAI